MRNLNQIIVHSPRLLKILIIGLLISIIASMKLYATSDIQGQDVLMKKVTVQFTNYEIKTVLSEIETKANVKFVYTSRLVPLRRKVSLKMENQMVSTILNELFKPDQIQYRIVNGRILLSVDNLNSTSIKKISDANSYNMGILNSPIRGTVTDERGESLPGVSIVVRGTQLGTITDGQGQFELELNDENAVLVFSFVGYQTKEVVVANQNIIDVILESDTKSLEELVVTGYSSQRKKDIVGSVSVVDMKATKSVPAGSVAQALQGQASGVNIINSGAPGAAPMIQVRGVSSFGNNNPLVLIDGIEGNLNRISAEDVESIQVLKDAGAAAIYGVRGANGVILVTTNKGKTGKPVLSYQTYYGVQNPLGKNPFNLLNSRDFMTITNRVNPNNKLFEDGMPDFMYGGPGGNGVAKAGDPNVDPSKYYLDKINTASNYLIQEVNKEGTDWFREVFKPAAVMNHHLSLNGGTEKSKYLLSLGYISQKGTLINTHLKRYSLRSNTEFKIGNVLRVGQNVNLIFSDNIGGSMTNSSIAWTFRQMPIIPVRDILGNHGGTFAGIELGASSNPVATQENTINNENKLFNVMGNIYAEIDFLKDLTFRSSIGNNATYARLKTFAPTPYNNREGNSTPNRLDLESSNTTQLTWTNTVSYTKQLESHAIKVILGSESIENKSTGLGGSSQGFFSMNRDYLILGNGTMAITNWSSGAKNRLFSLFGRIDYIWKDKYILGATLRRDGSSVFGSNRRYGVFPSFSLGWRISDEVFLKDLAWLTELKLRGGYGILGSQNNVDAGNAFNLYGGGYGTTYYDITGSSNSVRQGFAQTRIGNAYTGWEENIVTNLGFDLSILNNRFTLSGEYYQKKIKGLLFSQPLLATVGGATAPTVNIGDIQNAGLDIAVGYRQNLNQDVSFSVQANIMTYRNKVVHLPGSGYFDGGSVQTIGNTVRNQVGQEVSSFFGYDVIGLFQNEDDVNNSPEQTGAAPGRFKYRDTDGDGKITSSDRSFIGSPNPDFTYGLNLGMNVKKFDMMAVFYGSQGNKLVNATKVYTHFYGGYAGGKSNVLLNAWTPDNPNTDVPILEPGLTLSSGGAFNSYFVENGSFVKLKSLTIGYNPRSSLLEQIKLSNLRIYLQASNLFMITKYTGLDPEVGGSSSAFGIDYAFYPGNQRSFTAGLSLSF